MHFEPDIIVTAQDSPRILLIAAAKLGPANFDESETTLKHYMAEMRSPVGLLVSSEALAIYRDKYTTDSETSVERVGVYPIPPTWRVWKSLRSSAEQLKRTAGAESIFEHQVQTWLEELSTTAFPAEFSLEAQRALCEHVIPALSEGIVRAAGPREARTG